VDAECEYGLTRVGDSDAVHDVAFSVSIFYSVLMCKLMDGDDLCELQSVQEINV
jgi:hypothetical protein